MSSGHATTLRDVIRYSLKNAPQFGEQILSSKAQVELLKKVFAIYDNHLSFSTSYSQGINSITIQDETSKLSSFSLSKNIGAGVSLGITSGLDSKKRTSSNVYQAYATLDADIDLLQNLLGKMDRNAILIQEQDRKLIENSLEQARESLMFGIIESYIYVARLERLLKENRNLNKSIKSLVKATKRKKSIGAADNRSVLQMNAKLINSDMNIMELERLVEDGYAQLKTLSGGGNFRSLSWPSLPNINNEFDSNLSLKYLAIEKEKLELEYTSARWGLLPELKLSMSYQYGDYDENSYSYRMEESAKGVGIYLNFPLGNSAAQAFYKSSRLSVMANELSIKRETEAFAEEVIKYQRAVDNYKKQIKLASNVIKLQEERYNQELKAYTQGRSGINDVNTALNDLINAQITHVEKNSSFYEFAYGKSYLYGQLSLIFSK